MIASELVLVEKCMDKCAINYNDAVALSATEAPCMIKCYNKFFDSRLLVEKELKFYTHGNPYV